MSHILFIDTETTGLDPKRNGIISLCASLYKDGEFVESYETGEPHHPNDCSFQTQWYKFNKNFEEYHIDLSAMRVNKLALTQDGLRHQLFYQGRSGHNRLAPQELLIEEGDFAKSFANFLVEMTKVPNLHIGGMNVQFDLKFIYALLDKHHLNPNGVIPTRVVDTQIIAAFLQNTGMIKVPNLKSETLYQHFEIDAQGIHSAFADVEYTAQLYYKMEQKIKELQAKSRDLLPAVYRV